MTRKAKPSAMIVLYVALAQASVTLAQSPGTFTATGRMTTPRAGHTATLLTSGKVLIAGGRSLGFTTLASAELYDPDRGTFAPTGDMTAARSHHTATLLPDGRVLIAGGSTSAGQGLIPSNGAEIYDPSTGTFTATGNMIGSHVCQQANLLGNGKILIAGGSVGGPEDRVPNAELYDPATGAFAATGAYVTDTHVYGFNTCQGAVSTLLPDGRVLIVFESGDAELYDPSAGLFTRTGNPIGGGHNDGLPTATLLMNGKVLVAGGAWDGDLAPTGAELYDSRTGTFIATGNMITGHVLSTATLLPDGTVLMAGSFVFPGELANAEVYGPVTGAFTATGNLITARGDGQTATLLNSGQVLVAGGFSLYPAVTSNAEIYRPLVIVDAPALSNLSEDVGGQGAIWHAATGQVASPANPAHGGEVLAMYTNSLFDGGVIPPQISVGGRLAEVLFFGNAPGFPESNQVNFRVPAGVAAGPAVPVRLTYLGRWSNAVTIAVQ